MNLSENINPKECQSCGLCCKWFTIGYPKAFLHPKSNNEARLMSELERFLDLKSEGKIFVLEYVEEFAVVFDYPCKHFKTIGERVYCAIYRQHRPKLCEEFPYKKNDCEKYVKPLNTFTDSNALRRRFEEIKKVHQ